VEGKDRAFARQFRRVHSKPHRHDCVAKAGDLELPLLRRWQHKIATRITVAALKAKRCPGFSSLTVLILRAVRVTAR